MKMTLKTPIYFHTAKPLTIQDHGCIQGQNKQKDLCRIF